MRLSLGMSQVTPRLFSSACSLELGLSHMVAVEPARACGAPLSQPSFLTSFTLESLQVLGRRSTTCR